MASNAFAISRADCGNPLLTHKGSVPSNSGFLPGLLPKADFGLGTAQATSDDTLVRLFRAIGHHKSISELASVLAAEAAPLIRFDCVGISRRNDATHAVEWHVAIPGLGMESGSAVGTTGHLLTGWIYDQQEPLIIAALDSTTRLQSNILQRLPEGIQSICAVPLSCAQHKVGALFVGSMAEDAYGEEEIRFLSLVATQVCGAIENHLAHGQIAELKGRLEQKSLSVDDEEESRQLHGFEEIVGRSATLQSLLRQVETVAPTDCTVLICGETGTGKELIARAIHDRSSRHKASFVKLNCAAIPTGLLESELFGHEKGAFTGAVSQRIGRFELANHGTMFLDEIGEIPLELQPKLLRVLQEREFERLGNSRTLQTDTRLIAATNRDLEQMVEENCFRSDLFYRLNVFPIRIPALRERPEDIPLLVRHFTKQYARRMNKQIDSIASETMNALCQYRWPGNVRELQNVIERAVVMTKDSELRVPLAELKRRAVPNAEGSCSGTLEEAERAHILATLKQTDWVIAGANGAAARLGLHRSTLQFRMKKLGISVVRACKPS
jgi:formate hydrogenlyase transcriptional activator